MATEKGYWSLVGPIWDVINIYDGPEAFLTTFGQVQRECGLLYAAHYCQSEVCRRIGSEALEGFAARLAG